MQQVLGGKTAIYFNGDVSPFFRNKMDLRQGDPISSRMFDVVVDALGMTKQSRRATLRVSFLILSGGGGGSHLQFNTILMFELDHHNITTIKRLLLCCQAMYGMKINFNKCEVVAVGMKDTEEMRFANLRNGKLSSFLVSYVGLPTSVKTLFSVD